MQLIIIIIFSIIIIMGVQTSQQYIFICGVKLWHRKVKLMMSISYLMLQIFLTAIFSQDMLCR